MQLTKSIFFHNTYLHVIGKFKHLVHYMTDFFLKPQQIFPFHDKHLFVRKLCHQIVYNPITIIRIRKKNINQANISTNTISI